MQRYFITENWLLDALLHNLIMKKKLKTMENIFMIWWYYFWVIQNIDTLDNQLGNWNESKNLTFKSRVGQTPKHWDLYFK